MKKRVDKLFKDLEHDMVVAEAVLIKIPKILRLNIGRLEKHERIEALVEHAERSRKFSDSKYPLLLKNLSGFIKKLPKSEAANYSSRFKKLNDFY